MFEKIDFTQAFAIINKADEAIIATGKMVHKDFLHQVGNKTISMIGYSQIREKNYPFIGDALPILSLEIEEEFTCKKEDLAFLPSEKIELATEITTNLSDSEYSSITRDTKVVIATPKEIFCRVSILCGRWEGNHPIALP
jgi:hypothetical protein